jgi:tetratricopeptide (TPR) repeat protein/TolB-like protein/tRNA A-37 threonylcarbamoyl transferase component Bud32
MVGTTVSHYEIRAKLGGGGMGVVYRAEDTKLHRTVALKFLPPEMTRDDEAKERFVQEAQAASALDHPNICTIHDIDETDDGRLFICMACYDGETVKQKIARGPLPLVQTVEIALDATQGLVRAHGQGIVHRDIKPGNIFVTREGRAKILDFGLAKLSGQTRLTQAGTIVGTAAYMSPEQAKGKVVDHRTDLWSVGATLYHMVTGRLPFEADHPQAVLYAICHEDPEPVASLREGVSRELAAVIERCLKKDPSKRYGSAEELAADLARLGSATGPGTARFPTVSTAPLRSRRWLRPMILVPIAAAILVGAFLLHPSGRRALERLFAGRGANSARVAGAAAIPEERHVALLPLSSASETESDVLFAEGLTEYLTFRLSQLEQADSSFWILPSSEVREHDAPAPELVRAASGVTLALVGRIESRGPVLRLVMELVDTRTLEVLDTREFTTRSRDAFALPHQIVLRLVDVLGLEPESAVLSALVAGATASPKAHEAYLKGLGAYQLAATYGDATIDEAAAFMREAIREDPDYALAHAGLGQILWYKSQTTEDPQCGAQAVASLERAIELEAGIAPPHVTLATIHAASLDYDSALDELGQALEADPANRAAQIGLAETYDALGRLEQAERAYRDAIDARPGSWRGHRDLAFFYWKHREYDKAEPECQAIIALTPDNVWGYNNLAVIYDAQGRTEEACKFLKRANEIQPTSRGYSNLATAYFKQGQYEDAVHYYEVAVALEDDQLDDSDYMVWGNFGSSLSALGYHARALDAYRKAAACAEVLLLLQPNDPHLRSLLGEYYAELDEPERALELTQSALDLAPNDPAIMFRAGFSYEALGDRERALEWIERALERGYPLEEVETAPGLARLRADERYRRLIERTGVAS